MWNLNKHFKIFLKKKGNILSANRQAILSWPHYIAGSVSPPWWRHQMETLSALLALCAGNSPVTGEFPSQRPVMWSFDVFFDLHLNKRLSKQSRRRWFEMPSRSLWRHCNVGGIAHHTWYKVSSGAFTGPHVSGPFPIMSMCEEPLAPDGHKTWTNPWCT